MNTLVLRVSFSDDSSILSNEDISSIGSHLENSVHLVRPDLGVDNISVRYERHYSGNIALKGEQND